MPPKAIPTFFKTNLRLNLLLFILMLKVQTGGCNIKNNSSEALLQLLKKGKRVFTSEGVDK